MSDTIIKVENLSKKYIIGHQAQQAGWKPNRGNYVALRDVVASGIKSVGKRLLGKEKKSSYTTEEFWALKDINFEIKRGEVVGIIGRNGAGKSTLLKILSRITEPTTGRVELRGRVASLLEVGTGFHPELTGRENIYLNGSILGMSRLEIRKKFDEIVDFAEVEKFLDTPVKRYSSGMYVRLAFAVAAHLEPEILMVDEVLAVGDAAFQKKCLGKMEDVATNEGRTVLFVSHNLSVILGLCPNSIFLKSGVLLSQDKSITIVDKYMALSKKGDTINLSVLKHTGSQLFSQLKHISIYNKNIEHCSSFSMGDSLVIDILVEIKKEVNELELGIKISSKLGVPIHYLTSTWDGYNWKIKRGCFKFRMIMKEILLLPGHYIIGAWSSEKGQWSDDNVQDITQVEILSSDMTGFSPNFEKYVTSGCETYSPTAWEIYELDEATDSRG